ncbi:dnm1l [Symbiodinium pilosum]|uniref:Dnm1l protein n=1 Tax=Symbiodinium pilosum TaxID=2952 RepID=A0A812KN64_SYMPI|nr:dnm1l [Symbiodinium pilosum]
MTDPLAVLNAIHQVLVSAGLHADLSLPTIAVVGSQSVGKTSVLESLVGRDFLPRGTGIVTRRPLILQLQQVRQAGAEHQAQSEWAEFQHCNQRFIDFNDVRREIEAETARVCNGSGVSDEPILLRIFSPTVMDLTLVDLPGLTKVPTGDQPKDIARRIQDLVKKYVANNNTLILAVSAANVDLATSDALALAREVDPKGERTVGVLTKLDLAEENGTAFEALAGEVYPLRLGYTAVVCRSERASQSGMTFEDALKEEHDFFARQPRLQPLLSQCGIPNLAQRLQFLLLNHIREALPALRTNMQRVAEKCREELATLGDENLEKQMGQGPLLLYLISCYVRHFGDLLEGRVGHRLQDPPPAKLIGGARIHHIFHRVFAQEILQFDAFTGLSDMDIRVAMRNAAGPKPQLFVPEIAFERMVKRQIQKLEDPALQCVALVFEELKQLAAQSEAGDLQRFPGLREKILEVAHGVIRRSLQPTNNMVSNLIRIESEFINVDHPDFIGGLRAMSCVQETRPESPPAVEAAESRQPAPREADDVIRLPPVPLIVTPAGEPSEKERMDTELLKSLLLSYFTIVKRKIIDSVPKAIMHFMVNSAQESLHAECIAELYKSDLVAQLLQEPEELRQKRRSCEAKLAELQKAQDLLAQICDAAAGCA